LELKAEGFEFEGQSYLFWEYMRLLNEVKPKYFLLENVMMGEKWEKILSKAIGVKPIMINSSLVSAQNRQRLYWTNIGLKPQGLFGDLETTIQQPKDKGILLKDILQDNDDNKYLLSESAINRINRSNNFKRCYDNSGKGMCLTSGYYKQGRDNQYIQVDKKYFLSDKLIAGFTKHKERHSEKGTGFAFKPKNQNDKANCLRANASLCPTDNMLIVHNTMPRSSTTGKGGTGPLSRKDGKTYCLDTGQTNALEYSGKIRRLTPIECERLQTVKDNYTNHVSDSQRYKMLGNGWTVDVIVHILKYI
jgi:DNA (cytosine-5)-methyltransferase 3A